MFLINQQVTEEIKREIKKFLETNDNENTTPMGYSKSSSKRAVYSNTILPQEARKTRIDNLTLHLKQLENEEEEEKNPKVFRRRTSHKEQSRNKRKKK